MNYNMPNEWQQPNFPSQQESARLRYSDYQYYRRARSLSPRNQMNYSGYNFSGSTYPPVNANYFQQSNSTMGAPPPLCSYTPQDVLPPGVGVDYHARVPDHPYVVEQVPNYVQQVNHAAQRVVHKEMKPKKPKVVQSIMCDLCTVNCNSRDAYNIHIKGRRHTRNMARIKGTTTSASAADDPDAKKQKPVNSGTAPELKSAKVGKEQSEEKSKDAQPLYCETCKVECICKDAYDKHIQGKRHKRNVAHLTGSDVSIPAVNDLDAKKQLMVDCGAAAEMIKMCTICNVACNSQTVFDIHLAGKKHASELKKQQK